MDLLIVKSQYNYAKNSIEIRQEDRYNEAITYANEFIESHPESKLLDAAKSLKEDSEAGIEHAKRVIAEFQKNQEKYKAMLAKEAKADSTNNTIKTPIK